MSKINKPVTIRPVKKNDEPALAKIIREAFIEHDAPREGTVYSDPTTDHLFELFRKERSILWVAESEGEVLGCCGVYPTPGLPADCAELVKFYLSAAARGQGVGRELMKKSSQSAQKMGYTSLYIESLPQFSNAINMYVKQGFEQLKAPLGNSGHTGCDIWMLKTFE